LDPTQAKVALHVSVCVHKLPSSHPAPTALDGFEHVPVFGSQTPAVWQVSDAVHVTPSHGWTIRDTVSS
jgi:hypothetical protein